MKKKKKKNRIKVNTLKLIITGRHFTVNGWFDRVAKYSKEMWVNCSGLGLVIPQSSKVM